MATTKFYHGKVKDKLCYFRQYHHHCHRHHYRHHHHHYDNDNNNYYYYYYLLIIYCLLTLHCSKAIRVEKESETNLPYKNLLGKLKSHLAGRKLVSY